MSQAFGVPRFVVYSRSWCHLCEDMLAALRNCMARAGSAYALDVVDVDADPALVARFDELVPVLHAVHDDGRSTELCHYHLDESALLRYLGVHAGSPVEAAIAATP